MIKSPRKILLIDDEQDLLLGLAALVRRSGYTILTARNGAEGLQFAQTQHPDLIVCDVMMPPPNGIQLRQALAADKETAAIPFIFLTARSQQQDKNAGLELGADDYITKPFDAQELLLRIEAVLRRQDLGHQAGQIDAQQEIERFKKNIIRTFNQEFHTSLPVVLATLETVLQRSYETAPGRSQAFLHAAIDNTEKTKAIIQDLMALGELDADTATLKRDPIDIQVDFIWPLQELFRRFAHKALELHLILEPDVTNWASVFRTEAPGASRAPASRIVVRAPREEFTQAILALVNYANETSPAQGRVQVNLAYNGFGGCILTVTRQGTTLSSENAPHVLMNIPHLALARRFARRMGGDLVLLDALSGARLRLILPPGK